MKISAKTNVVNVVLPGLLIFFILLQTVFFKAFYTSVYPREYSEDVIRSADEFGVDPSLVYAVIRTESDFNPDAHSSADARGIMQITPDTFDWLQMRMRTVDSLSHDEMYDPAVSIRYGTYFLSLLKNEFHADKTVVSAYHAGRGTVNEWLRDDSLSGDGQRLDHIPYPSTASYVRQVMQSYRTYQALYE